MTFNSIDELKSRISEFNNDEYFCVPGFVDVHVHFREPGFTYKEDMKTGSLAAAHGGYTTVCAMPNLNPAPDSADHLETELKAIREKAVINVLPYATITVDEKGEKLSDMDALAKDTVAFSDDGHGVQSDDMMRMAMKKAKSLNRVIVAHCEDNSLLNGGYIHKGKYASEHGHRGICSESEWKQIERDIKLAEETGCAYHICHISAKESVELVRQAKKRGADVTCETAPHYLLMDDSMLREDGDFKMNPPVRDKSDRDALIKGIQDGTIDMIATDHAPHSAEEKSRGLEKSLMGIVGIETAFPLLYTYLVKKNIISMERLTELIGTNPRKRFNIPERADCFTVWSLKDEYEINPDEFLSKGRSTPFKGWKVNGRCLLTVCNGQVAYVSSGIKKELNGVI